MRYLSPISYICEKSCATLPYELSRFTNPFLNRVVILAESETAVYEYVKNNAEHEDYKFRGEAILVMATHENGRNVSA